MPLPISTNKGVVFSERKPERGPSDLARPERRRLVSSGEFSGRVRLYGDAALRIWQTRNVTLPTENWHLERVFRALGAPCARGPITSHIPNPCRGGNSTLRNLEGWKNTGAHVTQSSSLVSARTNMALDNIQCFEFNSLHVDITSTFGFH